MSDKEFWSVVYAAAINSGHSPKVAQGIANQALEHRAEEFGE